MPQIHTQRPPCMSPDQFALWCQAAANTRVSRKDGVCHDCTPAYQTRMVRQGKCSYPATEFSLVPGEGLVGNRKVIPLMEVPHV